jgi:hypothetical protein
VNNFEVIFYGERIDNSVVISADMTTNIDSMHYNTNGNLANFQSVSMLLVAYM